ncbi:family 16 glycosylhydrolase, partial [Microvirga arabica]
MSISSDRADTTKNWWHTLPGSSYFGDAPFRAPNHPTKPFAIETKGGETALKITMDKNPTTGQLESGLISTFYHDGTSHDKLDGDPYGYYEARLWLPEGNGTWPAFWSLESERLKPAAERDHVIEVDVMEHHGNTPTSYASVIHDWNWDNGKVVSGHTGPYHRNVVGDDVMTHGWHTYGVEVTKEKMNFYMDGKLHWSYATPATYTEDPMFMINLAAGGNWSIDPNLNNVSMWVDYFRHYEKMPTTAPTPTPTPVPSQPIPTPTPTPAPTDPATDTLTVKIA